MKYWTKEQESDLKRLRESGSSVSELCDIFGRTESAMRTKLSDLGIVVVDWGTWLPEHDDILRNYYANCNYQELTKMIPHKTKNQINERAKRFGLKKSKGATSDSLRLAHIMYSVNVSDVVNLHTPDGAALFGFILADGTIYSDRNVVKLTLANKDREYLKKVKSILSYDKTIKQFPSNDDGAVTLNINSKKLVDFIVSNVEYAQKSIDLKYPDIIKGHKYEADFIRGFFDGDGSISRYVRRCKPKNGCKHDFRFSLISTKEMCLAIQDSLNTLCGMGLKNTKLRKENRIKADNIYYLEYCESSLVHIGNAMYKSVIDGKSNLYLDRKLDRFKELWRKHGLWQNAH